MWFTSFRLEPFQEPRHFRKERQNDQEKIAAGAARPSSH
jgi:hypothetical protein